MSGVASPPALSATEVLDLIAKNAATSFVSPPSIPLTVAQLMAQFPASAATLNAYARVSDLYGAVDDIMRCRFDGTNYRWVPQRDSYAGNIVQTGGAVSLIPLVTPPVVNLTAGALANMTITPSPANAYIGQAFRIYQAGALGLFTATIAGLVGGGTIPILSGGTKTLVYEAAGWRAS